MSVKEERAARLRAARIAAGFETAMAAVEKHRWVYSTYISYENGTRLIRVAEDYAKAFKVSEGWLLTGKGQGPGVGNAAIMDAIRAGFEQLTPAEMQMVLADILERAAEAARSAPEPQPSGSQAGRATAPRRRQNPA